MRDPNWSYPNLIKFSFYYTLVLKLPSICAITYAISIIISSSYLMTFISCFEKFHFYPYFLYKFRVCSFDVLNLNYEKFKLYLQNTLNMLKMIRLYFGVLQTSTRENGSTNFKLHSGPITQHQGNLPEKLHMLWPSGLRH